MHPTSFFSLFFQLQLPLLAIHPVVSLHTPQFTWTGPLSLHAQLDPATSDTIILQHANTVPGVAVTCLFQGIFHKEINGSAVISGCRASPVVQVTIISRYLRGRTMFEIRGNLTQEVVSAYSGNQDVENDDHISRFRRSVFPGDVMAQYDYLDYSDPLPTDLVLKMKFAYDESFKRHLGSDAAARKYIAEVVTHGKEYFKEESLGTNIFLDIQGPPQLLPNKELDISGPSFNQVQEVKAEEPIPLSVFCYTDDQDSLMGVSKRGKACDANLGISLTKWRCNVLKAAQTFAHESGHMDGFFHDSWEDAVNAANGITTSCEGNGLMSDDTPFEDRPNAWSVCTSQRFEKWFRRFGKECIAEVFPCSEESGSWRTPCKCGSGPAPSLCVAGHTCCQHQTATCLGEPSDIVKLYAIIQSLKLEMERLRQNIGQNTVGITKNTEGITKNTVQITTNTAVITTSNAGIKKHTADISKNTATITSNTAVITKNTYSITKNTEGITKNTGGITTNTGGITKNTEGITKNTKGITKNTEGITKNTKGITKNTGGISKNTDRISTNTAALGTKCDIATCSDTQTTATKLESCFSDASSADCPPSASGKLGIIDAIQGPIQESKKKQKLLIIEAIQKGCDTSMKVGATVVRNDLDWKWGDQDGGSGNKGKVSGVNNGQNNILLTWENGHFNGYRWGSDGKNDVKIYCEDGCDTSMTVGSKVVRDDVDWIHGDQDGGRGSIGTIARKEVQKLHVTWDVNGQTHGYRWGKGGKTDVKPYCPKFL